MSKPNIEAIYPLTPMQEGMLFNDLYEPDSRTYFQQTAREMENLDLGLLKQACEALFRGHAVLRTFFVWKNREKPIQIVRKSVELPWREIDLSQASPEEREQKMLDFQREDRAQGFNLEKAPLIRLTVFHQGNGLYRFYWSSHHIILDGWCLGLLIEEIMERYKRLNRGESAEPPSPRPFRDYVAWLGRQDPAKAQRYWRQRLAGFERATALPGERYPLEDKTPAPAAHGFSLGSAVMNRLEATAQKNSLTLSTVVQGCFGMLLAHLTGESDVVFGQVMAGRPESLPGAMDMIGLFINTLPVRLTNAPERTILSRLMDYQDDLFKMRDFTYTSLVDIQAQTRVAQGTPLFQAMIDFQKTNALIEPDEQETGQIKAHNAEFTEYPLVAIGKYNVCLEIVIHYHTHRMAEQTALELTEYLRLLLLAFSENPNRSFLELDFLQQKQQSALKQGLRIPAHVDDKLFHQSIEAQVARTPNGTALICGSHTISYEALNCRANQLAHYLRGQGVAEATLVGICLPPGIEQVISLLAVSKAGAAFLSVAPGDPQSKAILAAQQPFLVISNAEAARNLNTFRQVLLDRETHKISTQIAKDISLETKPDRPAYALAITDDHRTISHGVVNRRLAWFTEEFPASSEDIAIYSSPITSHHSVWEIFRPLRQGATLIIVEDQSRQDSNLLLNLIRGQEVRVAHFTLSALEDFLNAVEKSAVTLQMHHVFISGAWPGQAQKDRFFNLVDSKLHYLYSFAEAGEEIAARTISREDDMTRVGLNIATHVPVYILDKNRRMVPNETIGGIYVGGAVAARAGSRLVKNPLAGMSGESLYDTGDQGFWLNGELVRVSSPEDRFVWIEDFRVDVGLVEAGILREPGVREARVVSRQTACGKHELIAYLVTDEDFHEEKLKSSLRGAFPNYMMPSVYVPLACLPMTHLGRLDFKALAGMELIDGDLINRWENRLRQEPGVEQVAVVARPKDESLPRLHLDDMIPLSQAGSSSQAIEATTSGAINRDQDIPLAIIHGAPLEKPDDASRTLQNALVRAAKQYGDHGVTLVTAEGDTVFINYKDLLEQAECVMTGLKEMGLKAGEPVILQIEYSPDFFPVLWGCILAGVIPLTVAIAPNYREENALVNKLHNAWELLSGPPILTNEKLRDSITGLAQLKSMEGLRIGLVEQLRNHTPCKNHHQSLPGDPVFFQLSSGSTGVPKCIQINHRGVIAHAYGVCRMNGHGPEDVSLNWMPLDHVGSILFVHLRDVIMACNTMHVEPSLILGNPLYWLELIEQYKVTFTWSPNFGYKLVTDQLEKNETRKFDLSSIKFFANGGEQVTISVAHKFLRLVEPFGVAMQRFQPVFGMAETCTGIIYHNDFQFDTGVVYVDKASLRGQLKKVQPDTANAVHFVPVGKPIPGISVRIVDQDDQLKPEGMIGRMQVKGPVTTPGYVNNEEANQDSLKADGWFNSGDLACILDGNIIITGREKETIIIHGANFYCYEIEDMVGGIEGVRNTFVAACGIFNNITETEDLAVFFVPENEAIDYAIIETIKRETALSLGVTPAYVISMTEAEFPKTTSGKIQRNQLKQLLEDGHFKAITRDIDLYLENERTLPNWFFTPAWQRKELPNITFPMGNGLVFMDSAGLGEALTARLDQNKTKYIRVEIGGSFSKMAADHYRINPKENEHYLELFNNLARDGVSIHWVLHAWTYAPMLEQPHQAEAFDLGLYSLLFLIQAVQRTLTESHGVRLLVVSSFSQLIEKDDPLSSERGALLGLLKTASQEISWLTCGHLDLPMQDARHNVDHLLGELQHPVSDQEVGFRYGRRWVKGIKRIDPGKAEKQEQPFKQGGMYLISGGLGGIGFHLAAYLQREFAAHLILVGKTKLPERRLWTEGVSLGEIVAERIESLKKLEQGPGKVVYEALDIGDLDGLQRAVNGAGGRWGRELNGVIHLAATYQEGLLADEIRDHFSTLLHPRVAGGWALLQLIKDRPKSLFMSFSTVNAHFGGYGVAAYAAAGGFLDHFTCDLARKYNLNSINLAWSLWEDVGMSRGLETAVFSRARGYYSITPEQGIQSLLTCLNTEGTNNWLIGLDAAKPAIRGVLINEAHAVNRLSAFYTASEKTAPDLSAVSLHNRFGMISHCDFHQIAEMPLTTIGEIDREDLASQTSGQRNIEAGDVDPETELEIKMADCWRSVFSRKKISMNDDFFALGGNSLLSVRLGEAIRRCFDVTIPLRILLDKPTVAGFVETVLAAMEQKGDVKETEQQDMAEEVVLDGNIWPPLENVDFADQPKAVFLTGATGFVGSFLLKTLLSETSASIYCLVRAGNAVEGKARIVETLEKYGMETDLERVIAVPGDLGQPHMGFEDPFYQQLTREIDVIYHCGSLVHFQYSYNMLKSSAVFGTQEALRLAVEGKLKAFHFISTIGVLRASKAYRNGIVYEDDELENWPQLNAGYVQSKWVAEKVTQMAGARGVPIANYRIGAVTGDSQTGAGDMGSSLMRRIRTSIEIGLAPITHDPWDLLPVDYVTRAIVHLSQKSDSVGKAFHLENPNKIETKNLVSLINKFGFPVKIIERERWMAHVVERLEKGEDLALAPLVFKDGQQAVKASGWQHKAEAMISKLGLDRPRGKQKLKFDQSNVRKGLKGSGIVCPAIDKHLLKTYLNYLIETGLLKMGS